MLLSYNSYIYGKPGYTNDGTGWKTPTCTKWTHRPCMPFTPKNLDLANWGRKLAAERELVKTEQHFVLPAAQNRQGALPRPAAKPPEPAAPCAADAHSISTSGRNAGYVEPHSGRTVNRLHYLSFVKRLPCLSCGTLRDKKHRDGLVNIDTGGIV